jgi:molybdate transport system substrate-binding protein
VKAIHFSCPAVFPLVLLAVIVPFGASGFAMAQNLSVFVAASLGEVFKGMGAEFEASHPGLKLLWNVASSGTLLQQASRGAPCDVLATADLEELNTWSRAQRIPTQGVVPFARNVLVLIRPAATVKGGEKPQIESKETKIPAQVTILSDLNKSQVKYISMGNPGSVPAGRYTKSALEAHGLWNFLQHKMVFTSNVRQALEYVARGESDAGFVYRTDIGNQKAKVEIVQEVPTTAPIVYGIAVLKSSPQSKLAEMFVNFVLSEAGQAHLKKQGFLPASM